jgi:hypothetical protein
LSERRLPGAYIVKLLGRSVAQIVANLDRVDLGGRRVLCPEGPASGDHFDVVSSLREGADVKNRLRFIEHERLHGRQRLRAEAGLGKWRRRPDGSKIYATFIGPREKHGGVLEVPAFGG